MFESSKLVKFIIFICSWFVTFFKNSVLCKVSDKITTFIMKLWHNCLIYNILYRPVNMDMYLKESVTGKMVLGLNRIITNSHKKCNDISKTSVLMKTINLCGDNILHLNIKYYCLWILIVSVFYMCNSITQALVLKTAIETETLYNLPISITLVIVSAILYILFMKKEFSISSLYEGSVLAPFVGGYFGIKLESKTIEYKPSYLFYGFAVISGILMFVIPPIYVLGFVVGIVGVMLTFYRTEVGVLSTIFLLPLMPTMIILGLSALSVISYAYHLLFTGKYSLKCNFVDFAVLLFAALIIISVPFSYISSSSLVMAMTYLLFISFYFTVKNTVTTRELLFSIVALMVVSGVLVALYGFLQNLIGLGLDSDSWLDQDMFDSGIRIAATLDNPNVLGEYLLIVIPIAFSMLYYVKHKGYNFLTFCAVGALCLLMILTMSRGAWLGLIFAMVIFVLMHDRRLIWLGVIAIVIAPLFIPQSIIDRFLSIGNMEDSSTAYRVSIWMASTELIKDFWLTGIGLSSSVFILVFQRYAFSASYALHSHNLFLQLIIDLGIWGLIIFFIIVFCIYRNIFSRIKITNSKFLKGISSALCGGVGGFLLQSMTDNTWYNYRIVCLFWVILAMLSVCSELMKKEYIDEI